jgi:hypothetical protein
MWEQDTASETYNWQQALSYCENLNLAEYDDWRLPNAAELTSLVDYSTSNPAVKTSFFPHTASSIYWSSTTCYQSFNLAWYINFVNGRMYLGDKLNDFFYVRAVRGGNALVDSDGDGIPDNSDNCPYHYNPGQEDQDLNGIGNACQCYIDANKDGKVNNIDFGYIKREIGRIDCCQQVPCMADGNKDNMVTTIDFSMFKKEYGRQDCTLIP